MSDDRKIPADWVAPAILAGVGVGLVIMIGLLVALTANDPVEASGLVQELDVYTACLSDHGANVPVVEARRDGGFSVTVPGSLVDGEMDTTAWREAHDQCSDVVPDLFGGLLGSVPGGLFGGFSGGFMDGLDGDFHGGVAPFDDFAMPSEFESLAFGDCGTPSELEALVFGSEFGPWSGPVRPPDGQIGNLPPAAMREFCEELENGTISARGPRFDRLVERCRALDR